MNTVGCHACTVMVREATYMVTSLIPGPMSVRCGQWSA